MPTQEVYFGVFFFFLNQMPHRVFIVSPFLLLETRETTIVTHHRPQKQPYNLESQQR